MATIRRSTEEAHESSSSRPAQMSHGRGGFGNIGYSMKDERPSLDTPTIKSDVYTTGRGGAGNMMANKNPDLTRMAQDVTGVPRREPTSSQQSYGRGGAANVFHPSADDLLAAREENQELEDALEDEKTSSPSEGLADKGKKWLFEKLRKGDGS